MPAQKYICPRCGKKTGVDILYGMPTIEGFEAADRGEIALGGCCIELGAPERRCLACHHEWKINRRKTNKHPL